MIRTFTDGHPKVLPACNFLSQYYFYNIFLQKSCRFSLQTLTKFEAAKTGSGVGFLRLTAVYWAWHSREHPRDLRTSGHESRAISVLSSIILPLQTFFSRVLLLRQQQAPERRPTTTIAIKTQVFMFRYELVNSTRKFTIVAEIVSLLKKIYKRDAPFRAVFKVKTLAVLFSAYPREMKHIPRNLNLPPFWRCLFLWKWCNPFPRARARLKVIPLK